MAYNVTRKYMYYDMDLKFNNNWCVLRMKLGFSMWNWNQKCILFCCEKKTEYEVSFSVWLSQGAIKKYQNSTKEMYSIIYSAERC